MSLGVPVVSNVYQRANSGSVITLAGFGRKATPSAANEQPNEKTIRVPSKEEVIG